MCHHPPGRPSALRLNWRMTSPRPWVSLGGEGDMMGPPCAMRFNATELGREPAPDRCNYY